MVAFARLDFDASAGDRDWSDAVKALNLALKACWLATREPRQPEALPPLDSAAQVVNMKAWREHREASRDPLDAATEAYVAAALRLLNEWAPDAWQLRQQMRLAAILLDLPDPLALEPHPTHAERTPVTPGHLLAMLARSSIGITLREQRHAASGNRP